MVSNLQSTDPGSSLRAVEASHSSTRANVARLKLVSRSTLADNAYSELRESIVSAAFKPGERLIEARLADELGVSRGTVRDALRRLAADGLVEVLPHRGAVVKDMSIEELVDISNVRVGIETSAIRLCVKLGVPTTRLRALIVQMEHELARGNASRLTDVEFLFHETLCELSGNDFLLRLWRSLAAQIRISMGRDAGHPEATAAAHVPLVEAIEAKNEQAAMELLEHHMNLTVLDYLRRNHLDELSARVLSPATTTLPPEILRIVGGLGDAQTDETHP
jgi:DNA-binding GntR family transcriptional regulator